MTNYNGTKPTPGRQAFWTNVQIGWKHTVDGDDVIYEADENGEPIPTFVRIPARVTADQMLTAAKSIDAELLQELTEQGGFDLLVELVGAVVGRDVVLSIAKDPTVNLDAFQQFILDAAETIGLTGDNPNSQPPVK